MLRGGLQTVGDTIFPFLSVVVGSVLGLAVAMSIRGQKFTSGWGVGAGVGFTGFIYDPYSRVFVSGYRYRGRMWKTIAD